LKQDVLNAAEPMPDIQLPEPLPAEVTEPAPQPIPETLPGWAFTNGIYVNGDRARTAVYGINLREKPQRDSRKLGYVPPDTEIIITGPPSGEYTPTRVPGGVLQLAPAEENDEQASGLGRALLGLHASADPGIREAEFKEFADLRPGIIKVHSFHSAEDIGRLAAAHPDAEWIVRAFLSFGGRKITPDQFLQDTIGDVRRALAQLRGRPLVVELHNEPNLVSEGLGSSWSGGHDFSLWWCELLQKYRRALPGIRFIYPGVSPGGTITGEKLDHLQFLEASREAVEAADGLGVHLYWSNYYPMGQALQVLDDLVMRFRSRPIWVTEASHNFGTITPMQMSQEYLRFWRELQNRPLVEGVTYFVASAQDPELASQVWVGRGIGQMLGKR
jgi:hypothetical protein